MKYRIIIILLSFAYSLNAQHHFAIKTGLNYPVIYSGFNASRQFGMDLGLTYNKHLIKNLSFETGFNVCVYGRFSLKIKSFRFLSLNPLIYETAEDKTSYYTFDLGFPVLLALKKKNFEYKAGILLYSKCFWRFSKTAGYDPEIISPNNYDDLYLNREYGTDIYIGINRKLNNKTYIYLDFKTPLKTSQFKYGLIGIGINYQLGKTE